MIDVLITKAQYNSNWRAFTSDLATTRGKIERFQGYSPQHNKGKLPYPFNILTEEIYDD